MKDTNLTISLQPDQFSDELLPVTPSHQAPTPVEQAKYGRCAKCSCPQFQGNGSTCTRNGCGHHFDNHW